MYYHLIFKLFCRAFILSGLTPLSLTQRPSSIPAKSFFTAASCHKVEICIRAFDLPWLNFMKVIDHGFLDDIIKFNGSELNPWISARLINFWSDSLVSPEFSWRDQIGLSCDCWAVLLDASAKKDLMKCLLNEILTNALFLKLNINTILLVANFARTRFLARVVESFDSFLDDFVIAASML